ncbi:unnamed protein product, partial [Mesorhabditis spiculigera]
MDFFAFPREIQQDILRMMDFQSLHYIGRCSKASWKLAEEVPGKIWDGALMWDGSLKYTGISFGTHRRHPMPQSTHKMLFANSTVHQLLLQREGQPISNLKAINLSITYSDRNIIEVIQSYAPITGKYRQVELSNVWPTPELYSWLNGSNCSELEIRTHFEIPLFDYLQVKHPRVLFRPDPNSTDGLCGFAKRIICKWLTGEREIEDVQILSYHCSDLNDEWLENLDLFWAGKKPRYRRSDGGDEGQEDDVYGIEPCDGEWLWMRYVPGEMRPGFIRDLEIFLRTNIP